MATRGLLERLRYLRSREALATAVLPALVVWSWWNKGGDVAWGLRGAALALLVWILVQGTLYWHLKLASVEKQAALPSYFHGLFRAFKWSNLAGIGGLLAVLLALPDQNSVSASDLRWSAVLLAGAALEQVNYYHYQLMYDTRAALAHLRCKRRLRKAALGIDMMRSGSRTGGTA